jgi:hypothetical protein
MRLPVHGSLGASPAAAVSPFLPVPVSYGLLLIWAIASAVLVVMYALQPICGRLVSWLAIAHLFCSLPFVTYTIANDWPEIAVAYVAIVACLFAPHALLAVRSEPRLVARRIAWLSIAGRVWSLVAVAHSGYWPHVAATLVCAAILALCRWDQPLSRRSRCSPAAGPWFQRPHQHSLARRQRLRPCFPISRTSRWRSPRSISI